MFTGIKRVITTRWLTENKRFNLPGDSVSAKERDDRMNANNGIDSWPFVDLRQAMS
ncbi:hypothetical protein FHK02_3025 [Spirosoma sp. LMG 31448]|uniref:Uncharacterized protein n=1 Tax=Spirosoma utsteinense TaxID=2585773 RepID=A0ABR6W074_9BACT|nr:hypothetical protein [Spirosoma utsteinense]MBC3789903.1 hypothetical protein [Spirosoma utsteinense]